MSATELSAEVQSGQLSVSTSTRRVVGVPFCFREFKIAVASVWLHDVGYQLRTTRNFLGLNGEGAAAHSRAGGHVYPLGSVTYPAIQPI